MELPDDLKKLYRHWPEHVGSPASMPNTVAEEMRWFVEERVNMWERKQRGEEPHTSDPVLSKFRFCNIYRELDRQTIEYHEMLSPLRDNFALWLLNMFYARMVARPQTVMAAGLLSFDAAKNRELYDRLIKSPRPRYGTPYLFPITVIQASPWPTREIFIAEYLPRVMQNAAKKIETWNKRDVVSGVREVLQVFGFPLYFLWTEVLIDVAYQYPERIDLFKKFPIGPGSAPSWQKIAPSRDPVAFVEELSRTRATTSITYNNQPLVLSAENWEGIGCEYRKYSNLKAGKGRRRLYQKF